MKILGIKELREALPFRYPMLMLDRVRIESDTKATGLKNLSFNEIFFQGHFPNHPIMPGVLQVLAMKQTMQVLVADKINPDGDKEVYLQLLEKVKFRRPNNPGDRVMVDVEITEISESKAVATCSTRNNTGVTSQAIITLGIRDKATATEILDFNEFDKNDDIPLDVCGIMNAIPHRYPFLFIDNIVTAEEDHMVAVKNTTCNEELFQGGDPDFPTLPGSIQAEILAQAGCTAVLSRPENKGKIGYFMSIDRAEFFHPVLPGDQIVIDVVLPPSRGRFGKGQGQIKVGDKVCSEIVLTFAIVDSE